MMPRKSSGKFIMRPRQLTIANTRYTVCFMTNRQSRSVAAPGLNQHTHRTTGINLPVETWELLRPVAVERSRRSAGRGSVSALLVELVDRHRRELEKELAAASR